MATARPVTKRTFLAGITCRTKGWFRHHAPSDEVTPAAEWAWYTGNAVQTVARAQLGEGVLLLGGSSNKARDATTRALADPDLSLLFEATFTARGCVARADALRRNGAGWEVLEIKAATSKDDGKIAADLIDDVAYTTLVMTEAGVRPERCLLMLVDSSYRHGLGQPLLREIDVTELVRTRSAEFALLADRVVAACQGEHPPAASLILACKDCEFYATECLGVGIADSIFHIPRLLKPHFDKLRPHTRLSELSPDPGLTPAQLRFLRVWRTQQPFVDRTALAVLDQIEWPVHYLDFEAASPALPWFEGDAPYRTLLFQYSIHSRPAPEAELEHRDYLAETGADWRRSLAETLLRDLGSVGSIMVYTSYERTRLRELGDAFPDLKPALDSVTARLVDLAKVIATGYEHPGFLGRTSIKQVLPVMAADLSYEALEIAGGMDAAAIFALMQVGQSPEAEHAKHRANLLQYCGLDTLAMVRVHQALEQVRAIN